MKLVVQVKLLPTPEQAEALEATLYGLNRAASRVSRLAFETGTFQVFALRRRVYGELKAAGLGAQQAQHVIKKVADAYTTLRGLIRNGRLTGGRRRQAESKPIAFRAEAAHPFDDRCLSWLHDARTVSIWTVHGRIKDIAFTGSADQLKTLAAYRRGESDLLLREGMWYLIATCEIPEAPLHADPQGWIGVDRGIVNLATTSDGIDYSGDGLNHHRRRMARVRAELQARGTTSARRKLKRRAKREHRFATHTNHVIANEIVADAQRTGRGIAVEELTGIRERVRLWPSQRATLSSWPFHQLGDFLAYKARRAGVAFVQVDPAYTSQMCPNRWCGHTGRGNRPSRDSFRCGSCGFAGPDRETQAQDFSPGSLTCGLICENGWVVPVAGAAALAVPVSAGVEHVKGSRPAPPRCMGRRGSDTRIRGRAGWSASTCTLWPTHDHGVNSTQDE